MRAKNRNKTAGEELSKKELILFALADVFGGGGLAILSVIYLPYLTNILKINPAWAGAVVMISKAWDAISDPLMGVISDNTRSKIGRRRPYLILGGLLLIPIMALLWYPVSFESQIMRIVYVTLTYLLYATVSTIIAVPYSSMSTEITNDYSLRNKANLSRLAFSLLSTAICTLAPTMLFSRLTRQSIDVWQFYFILVLGFGTYFAVPNILAGVFCKERVPYGDEKIKFSFKTFIKPLRVKSFRKLIALHSSQSVALDIVSAVVIYYALYVVSSISSTIFLGTFLVMQLILYPFLMKKVDSIPKTKIYRFGLPLTALGALGIALFPKDASPVWLYVITAFTALGFAGAQTMSWIIFPDVVDIGELSLKQRMSGSFSGVMTFIRKVSAAIAIFLVGSVLGLTGFIHPTDAVPIPVQPLATQNAIRMLVVFAFVIIMGFAFFVARSFKISPELSKRIKQLLEIRRTREFTPEEDSEVDNILKQFG
ncbi:MAG: MFS transporter [Eubacteriales bacterium]|nr:MFS transporter [Eubacteriales bacterium]